MNYFLVNPKGMALSQYNFNDITGAKQLRFRKNDWYSYSSIEEAEKYREFIMTRGNVTSKKEAMRLDVSMACNQLG